MNKKICVIPRVQGIGGMVSFLHKFTEGAAKQGVTVTQSADEDCDALLIIGGTRDLGTILKFKKNRKKIVQRLDGINWIYRLRPISLKHSLRSAYGNLVLAFIRRYLADEIIYQSEFSKVWWEKQYGPLNKPTTVVHNGVNLQQYSPSTTPKHPPFKLLVVEGSMGGGYESGLENAILLANGLVERGQDLELIVVGEVSPVLRKHWHPQIKCPVNWVGSVKREQIPEIDRQAHLLFSADIHPACPNSVLEALACGLPVISFDTGSLKELVGDQCGSIVDYGANSWKLEKPNIANLVEGAEKILANWDAYSNAAREHAQTKYGLEKMVESYCRILVGKTAI